MSDFIVALGLVLVIEGLIFAASPGAAKNAMAHNAATNSRNGALGRTGT